MGMTTVHVHYTAPGPGMTHGRLFRSPASLPEVGEGRFPIGRGACNHLGFRALRRRTASLNRGLARARNGGQIGLRLIDPGVRWQPGDVVLARSPRQGLEVPVRLTSHAMPTANRYQIRARPYLESEPRTRPMRPILRQPSRWRDWIPARHRGVPGWAQVDDANDRLLRGAANDGEIGYDGRLE